MNKFITLLMEKNFFNFFLSDIITNIGVGIGVIGINWFIIDYTHQNEKLGIYMALSLIFSFFMAFFIGTLLDKYDRRYIIIISNLIQAFLFLMILVLFFFNIKIYGLIYILALITSTGLTIYMIASKSLIQEIIKKEVFLFGNTALEMSQQLGTLIAAFISGICYKRFGFTAILIVFITSLILSSLFILKVNYIKTHSLSIDETYTTKFVNGIEYLFANKVLLIFGIIIYIPYIVTASSNVVLPGYVKEYLRLSSVEYGISDMLFGVGAFISGLIIASFFKNTSKLFLISSLFVLSAITLGVLFFNKFILVLYIAYLIFGVSNTSIKIILNTIIMNIVPKEQYGRAASFWYAVSSLIQAWIVIGISRTIDTVSVNFGYLILSFVMLLGLFLILIFFLPNLMSRLKAPQTPI